MSSVGRCSRFLLCLAVVVGAVAVAMAWPQAARAAEAAPGFTIEGVADPAQVKRSLGLTDAAQLEERVCQETYSDALLHLSYYTQGVPFAFDFAVPMEQWRSRPFGSPRMQTLKAVLPKQRSYQVLGTHLTLGRITFAASDVADLGLAKGLADLPVYVAQGQFPSALYRSYRPSLWITVHWLAASDCYQTAIMQHLVKTYGNRPVKKVSGRVFPVRVVKATLEKAATPATPTTPTPPGPGSGAGTAADNGRRGTQPTPAAPAPVAPAAGTPATETPPAPEAPPEAEKKEPAAAPKSEGTAAGTTPAAAPTDTPPPAAAPEPAPAATDAPQQKLESYVYHLEMEVRVEITQVEFGDQAAPATEGPKAPATEPKPATAPKPATEGQSGTAPTPAPAPAPAPATGPAPAPASAPTPGGAGTPGGS